MEAFEMWSDFNDDFIANLLLSVSVKEFCESLFSKEMIL